MGAENLRDGRVLLTRGLPNAAARFGGASILLFVALVGLAPALFGLTRAETNNLLRA